MLPFSGKSGAFTDCNFRWTNFEFWPHRKSFKDLGKRLLLARIAERGGKRVAQQQKHAFGGNAQHHLTARCQEIEEHIRRWR
jgi:hypothetical protein